MSNLGGFRPPQSLPRSVLLSFPLVDSPGGLGRAHSTAAKHFDAVYTVSQLSLIKSTLMFSVLQKSVCMQSSATVGRTDPLRYTGHV